MDTNRKAEDLPLVYWGTSYVGKITGLVDCNAGSTGNEGPMQMGSQLSINGTNDLSKIIVGSEGAFVQQINYTAGSHRDEGALAVLGQGPSGRGTGSLDLYFLTQAGSVLPVSLTKSDLYWRYENSQDTSGIIAIWWAQSGQLV